MHLIALVESPDHVCCRYRLSAYQDELARAGHTLELRSLPRTWLGRVCIGSDLADADAVVLQRRLLPAWQRRLLRRSVRRLIFDFDDAIFGRDSYSPRGVRSLRRWKRFAATVRQSDAVVAGNAWLRDRARAAGAGGPVFAIPSCVDPALYPMSRHGSSDGLVRLVWVGSASTQQGLQRIAPWLNAIGRAAPNVQLRMICDRSFRLADLPVEFCAWDSATEALAISGGDIGICWMPDDDWSRGKCGLKILQYMAAGLPVIANPVGVHVDLIEPGVTGFLAKSEDEWITAVRTLAADPDLRRQMGAEARARIERDFSVETGARLWLRALDSLVRASKAA